ncbi:hypothetical protein JW698_01465 [Candidatus Wolfebacteria bacterium]|nr:hypothetical protein [Candidatus Wolfebacteria bacterium]
MNIIQKITDIFNYVGVWFDKYILSGLADFLKALGDLIIKILEILIDIVRWIISYL